MKQTTTRAGVSLIIPVLNEETSLQSRLADLQVLLSDQYEVIVVDGGSSDRTVEIASDYATVVMSAPPGRARQMNRGASAASGQLLWFVHADTKLDKTALSELSNLSHQQGSNPFWGRFDVRVEAKPRIYRCIETLMNWRSRFTGIATGDQAIFVSTELFRQCGTYRDIPLMEDIDLSARLQKIVRPHCLRTRVSTSARRWQKNGVSRTVIKMWALRLGFFLGVAPERLVKWYYPSLVNNTGSPPMRNRYRSADTHDSNQQKSDVEPRI